MASLKQTAKSRGMGGFLQVSALLEAHPGLKEFFGVVTAVKPVPAGVENASTILVFDELPIDSCNEIALNLTNTKRIIAYLEREFASSEDSLLVDSVVHFRIREYPGFQNGAHSQYGIEISRIDPSPDQENARAMVFELPKLVEPTVADPNKPTRAQEIRKAMEAKLKAERAKNEPPFDTASAAIADVVAKTHQAVTKRLRRKK